MAQARKFRVFIEQSCSTGAAFFRSAAAAEAHSRLGDGPAAQQQHQRVAVGHFGRIRGRRVARHEPRALGAREPRHDGRRALRQAEPVHAEEEGREDVVELVVGLGLGRHRRANADQGGREAAAQGQAAVDAEEAGPAALLA